MNVVRCVARSIGLVAAAIAMIAGCASVERAVPKSSNLAAKRQDRNRAAARRFEQKRNAADLEAATARWQQGDLDGAEEMLGRLLARTPDHLEARLLMAELLLTDDRAGEAIAQLEPALAASGEDARVQHMMGLVLDATGQSSRALACYEQAVRLQPHNQVYAVSFQTAAASETDSGGVPEPEESRDAPETRKSRRGPKTLIPPRDLPWAPGSTEPAAAAGRSPEGTVPASGQSSLKPIIQVREADASGMSTFSSQDSESPSEATLWVEASDSIASDLPEADDSHRSKAPARLPLDAEDADPARSADSAEPPDRFADTASGTADGLIEQGVASLSAGRNELALAYFQEAISLKPDDPQIPISAAVGALRHNRPDVAVALAGPLMERFSDSAALARILGAASYRLGDYRSSQVALQQALSLDKSSALSYFLMGCTLVKLGELPAAEVHFRQARRLDPRYAVRP